MTAGLSIDPVRFLNEQLSQASPDLMRELLTTFVNALLSAQADALCGAPYGERSEERVNSRNGYRHRDLDTRLGTLDVAVPRTSQSWPCAPLRDPPNPGAINERTAPAGPKGGSGGR